MSNIRSYDVGGVKVEISNDSPDKAKESIDKLAKMLASLNAKSPDVVYSGQIVKVLEAYNTTVKKCYEVLALQNAAGKALDENKGLEFVENFKNARLKFRELQAHAKAQIVSLLNKIPELTPEILARYGSEADTARKTQEKLIEWKEFAISLYKDTESSNKNLIKLAAKVKELGDELAAGKASPSAEVHPASQKSQPQGVPSAFDAKKQNSQLKASELKAADLNRLSGGGNPNVPNAKK